MLLGLGSDIHCNVEGLRQALAAMGDVDHLICLGDSIHESQFSNEVVALLREREADVIRGNHEAVFYSSSGGRARERPWIDANHMEWLGTRPERIQLDIGGRKILAIHSTPWSPSGEYVFPHSPALKRFGDEDADFVLYGHTHMQMVKRIGRPLVVNPGSAGERRGGNSLSGAVLDLGSGEVRVVEFALPAKVAA